MWLHRVKNKYAHSFQGRKMAARVFCRSLNSLRQTSCEQYRHLSCVQILSISPNDYTSQTTESCKRFYHCVKDQVCSCADAVTKLVTFTEILTFFVIHSDAMQNIQFSNFYSL